MKTRLDAVSGGWAREEYVKPSGEPASKVIGASAERISDRAPERQETVSSVYHVIEGEGKAIVDGNSFDVKQGDTLCVPSWTRYEFNGKMYLYRLHDKPMLERLGYYRNRDEIVSPYDLQ